LASTKLEIEDEEKSLKRFNVIALLVDQIRYVRNTSAKKPAVITRLLIILSAPTGALFSWWQKWEMNSVGELVGALGLLAGVFISAFAIVFGVRLEMGRRPASNLKQKQAFLMDEAALTLLSAGLLAGLNAIVCSVVSAVTPQGSVVGRLPTAIVVAISVLVVLYFLMSIRRLHILYIESFPPPWKIRGLVMGIGSDTTYDLRDPAHSTESRRDRSTKTRNT
jgi:hypothetical protein